MSNPEALRELVMDTLFIFNLSELALVLEEAYGFNEARFWDRVRTILTNYARQHPEQRSRLDRLGWDQPHPLTESLLRSKLKPDSDQPRHCMSATWSRQRHRVEEQLRRDRGKRRVRLRMLLLRVLRQLFLRRLLADKEHWALLEAHSLL